MPDYNVTIHISDEQEETLQEAAANASKTPGQMVIDLATPGVLGQLDSWLSDKVGSVLAAVGVGAAYKALKALIP